MIIQWEPVALDHWPTIITLVTGTQNVLREDYTDTGDPKYRVTYGMRTYIWCKDVGTGGVTQMRDNLTTVVRDALIDHPSLRDVPRSEHCEPYIEESSVREEFSDLTSLKGERFLAGAYVGYDMTVSEVVEREPPTDEWAYVLGVDVDVYQLAKIPNAPTIVLALADEDNPGQINLTWRAPTWNGGMYPISGYQIEVSTDGGVVWSTETGDTGNVHPYAVFTGLDTNTTYQYRVAALNQIGVGAISAPSNAISPN
jgi:hypothetical protein